MSFVTQVITNFKNFLESIQADGGEIQKALDNIDSEEFKIKFNLFIKSKLPKEKSGNKKDIYAPKRTRSAYIYYCIDARPAVKEKNIDMLSKDITRELGKGWKSLDDDKKSKYDDLAIKDKERYDLEKKEYVPPEPNSDDNCKKNKKKSKGGPRRSVSSYIYFCQDMRPATKIELEKKSNGEKVKTTLIVTELGKKWKEITQKNRKKYDDLAAIDKERFESEKESWVDNNESDSSNKKKVEKKKVDKKKVEKKKVDTDSEPEIESCDESE